MGVADSHQNVLDLHFWKKVSGSDVSRRYIIPPKDEASLNTDAADVGYGGARNKKDLRGGSPGKWCDQGVCNQKERAESIT